MNVILIVIGVFMLIVGALTIGSSSVEAANKKDYNALAGSTALLLAGIFVVTFFWTFDIGKALFAVVVMAIVVFVYHTIVSYVELHAYKFENGKMQRTDEGVTQAAASANDEDGGETSEQSAMENA